MNTMTTKATDCDLVLILEELNFDCPREDDDYGTIKSWCRFFVSGSDASIKKIIDLAPTSIRRVICDLLSANMLEVWHGNSHYTELPIQTDDPQFKFSAVVSPVEFIEYLVNNPIHGYQANVCVQERYLYWE